jgi:imidazolonepropionase-like amidohydrolase
MENELGRIREGFLADLVLVDENLLENFKVLYPNGILERATIDGTGKLVRRGGVE